MGKQARGRKPAQKAEEKPPGNNNGNNNNNAAGGRPWGEPESASSTCVHQRIQTDTWSTNLLSRHNGPCHACRLQERLTELDRLAEDPSSPGHWDEESILNWIPQTQAKERKEEEESTRKKTEEEEDVVMVMEEGAERKEEK